MLCVRDVMTEFPITIAAEASLRDAVELLEKHGVSGLPVVRGQHVVGTLSARNIIGFEAITPGVPTERDSEDVWGEGSPVFDEDNASPATFFAEMWEDAGADVVARFSSAGSAEWDVLREHTAEEAMSTDLLAVPPTASVHDAAEYMGRTGAHRVLVVERGRLLGIVTTMDVTRAVADNRLHDGHPLTSAYDP